MLKNNFLEITCFVLIVLSTSNLVLCRPAEKDIDPMDENIDPSNYNGNLSIDVIMKIRKCDRDQDTMELCMRCAKVTKAVDVYPLCCANEDNVKDWCEAYIYYGLQ